MKDAWEQLHRLLKRTTKTYEVRKDIEVVAHGTERGVELILRELSDVAQGLSRPRYITTNRRNIATMRQLAKALNDACDFVEAQNPKWASHTPIGTIPVVIEK